MLNGLAALMDLWPLRLSFSGEYSLSYRFTLAWDSLHNLDNISLINSTSIICWVQLGKLDKINSSVQSWPKMGFLFAFIETVVTIVMPWLLHGNTYFRSQSLQRLPHMQKPVLWHPLYLFWRCLLTKASILMRKLPTLLFLDQHILFGLAKI